jgi:hypothetical protein
MSPGKRTSATPSARSTHRPRLGADLPDPASKRRPTPSKDSP